MWKSRQILKLRLMLLHGRVSLLEGSLSIDRKRRSILSGFVVNEELLYGEKGEAWSALFEKILVTDPLCSSPDY